MIYFARRRDGKIKIGSSAKPNERLKTLRSEYGEVDIVAVMDGGHKQESLLHKHFAKMNTGLDGREWFHPSESILEYIATNAKPVKSEREVIPPRIPKGRKMNARIPVTESTQEIFRDFCNGLETCYEDALLFLLSNYVANGERPLLAGRRNYEKFTEYLCRFISEPKVPVFPKPKLADEDVQPIAIPPKKAAPKPRKAQEPEEMVDSYSSGESVSLDQWLEVPRVRET